MKASNSVAVQVAAVSSITGAVSVKATISAVASNWLLPFLATNVPVTLRYWPTWYSWAAFNHITMLSSLPVPSEINKDFAVTAVTTPLTSTFLPVYSAVWAVEIETASASDGTSGWSGSSVSSPNTIPLNSIFSLKLSLNPIIVIESPTFKSLVTALVKKSWALEYFHSPLVLSTLNDVLAPLAP